MKVTTEDIIGAYKIFLDRQPESMEVVQSRLGKTAEMNLIDFALSEEFLKRPEVAHIIFQAAQILLDEDKKNEAPNDAAINTMKLNWAPSEWFMLFSVDIFEV